MQIKPWILRYNIKCLTSADTKENTKFVAEAFDEFCETHKHKYH